MRRLAALALHSDDDHLLFLEAFDFAPGGRFPALISTALELRDHALEPAWSTKW